MKKITDAIAECQRSFALGEGELADLAALMRTWVRIEELDRRRAESVAAVKDDAAIVDMLRRMAPQAEIVDNGASVTINGDLVLAIADVRERLARDPSWLLKQMRVERPRALTAETPLVMETDGAAALEKAKGWTKDDKVQEQIAALRDALGDRAFAGLVADLTLTPAALPDLVAFIELDKLAAVIDLIGADAVGGMLVEFRASPGRLKIFVDGVIANRERLSRSEVPEYGLLDSTILHSRLTMPMHRAAVAERAPDARELRLRERTPQERSQVTLVQQEIEGQQDPDVRASALGHALGGGRAMEVAPDVPSMDGSPTMLGTLPITKEDRESEEYTAILQAIYDLEIRQVGRAQLAELADVFMAAAKTGTPPRFLTAHAGIIDALGLAAGYDMAARDPKQPYAHFFAAANVDRQIELATSPENMEQDTGPIYTDETSFPCVIKGAVVEVVPIDTVRFSRQAPETSVMRLAATNQRATGAARLHEASRVKCTRLETATKDELPKAIEGVFRGYKHDGTFIVEDSAKQRHDVSPDAYEVEVIDSDQPRMAYASWSLEQVQEMFPHVPNIAKKLRGLITRTVGQEVEGIDHYTVEDYMRVLTDAGFDAYIVGGAVRDVVSGKKDPSDIDIATTMPAIDALSGFESRHLADRQGADGKPSARTIPMHGITQVEHQVETGLDVVSLHTEEHGVQSMDLATDVSNRDFTINTLFYDPASQRVIDPTGKGLEDLKSDTLRWTCFARGPEAIENKLRNDSYQVGRWIKFVIKGMKPALPSDVQCVRKVFKEHLAAGLTPEEKARILDGIGKPLAEVIAKAAQIGIDAADLAQLSPLPQQPDHAMNPVVTPPSGANWIDVAFGSGASGLREQQGNFEQL